MTQAHLRCVVATGSDRATSAADPTRAFVIHLGMGDPELARLEDAARSRRMSVIELDLQGLSGRAALVDYLSKVFMFPHEIGGLDAAVDLISDLEWFGNTRGYVVVARGVAGATFVGESFVSILPNIIDRWRSQRSRSSSPRTEMTIDFNRHFLLLTVRWSGLVTSHGPDPELARRMSFSTERMSHDGLMTIETAARIGDI